jgi:hypothetical protein
VPKPPRLLPFQELLLEDERQWEERTPRVVVHARGRVEPAELMHQGRGDAPLLRGEGSVCGTRVRHGLGHGPC